MPDQIAPSDLQLFADAQAGLLTAQGVLQFISAHLSKTYGLTPADQVDLKTGAITRPVTADPAA